MTEEQILTPEQVAEYLMVPLETVMDEIYSGKLQAMQVGSFVRVREYDLAEYKNRAKDFLRTSGAPEVARDSKKSLLNNLRPTDSFEHVWPDGKREHFTEAVEGIVFDGSRERHVKIGFTNRVAAGMNRRRALVLVGRYATVEFVGANNFEQSRVMASVIKDSTGKQIPVGGRVPLEYLDMKIGAYRESVDGPRASANLGVICKADDFTTMVKHALIRTQYNELPKTA